jgi:hypothetical protein
LSWRELDITRSCASEGTLGFHSLVEKLKGVVSILLKY